MKGQGEGGSELLEREPLLGEPGFRPVHPGGQATGHPIAGACRQGPAASGKSPWAAGVAAAELVPPGPGAFGEDRRRLTLAVPGLDGRAMAGVERIAAGQAGAAPEARRDEGERALQGLQHQLL